MSEPVRPTAGFSQGRLTLGLCIGITAIAFESMAVSTAMPAAAAALGATSWYAWAFSIFQAAMLFANIAAGRLCDRIGPVRPMLVGMVVFAAGLVVAGLAPTMAQLVVGRAVQGLGGGAINVALYVVIAQVYAPMARPRVMSWTSTAWVLPGLVGPLVSGWITTTFSWHWVFGAVLPVLVLAAALMVPILLRVEADRVESPAADPDPDPAPVWAAGLAALAVPLLQYAAQRPGWTSVPVALVAVALLAAGLPRLLPAGIWTLRPGLGPVMVVRALIGGVFFTTETFTVLMLQQLYGLQPWLAGLVLTISSLGWTAGSFLQARWLLRRDVLMTIGATGIGVGVLGIIAVVLSRTGNFWLIGVVWVVAGLGMGTAFASTTVATMALSGGSEQGRNASALQLSEALGGAVIVGLTGALYASLLRLEAADLHLVFAPLFGVSAVLILCCLLISRRIGPVAH